LQQDIANNRRQREKRKLVEFDPFDEDATDPKDKVEADSPLTSGLLSK
jgi:hypothetical protein